MKFHIRGIRSRLLVSFGVLIAGLMIFDLLFLIAQVNLVWRYQAVVDNMTSEYDLTEVGTGLVHIYNNLIKSPNSEAEQARYHAALAEIDTLFARLDRTIVDPDSKIIYLGLKNTIRGIVDGRCEECGRPSEVLV